MGHFSVATLLLVKWNCYFSELESVPLDQIRLCMVLRPRQHSLWITVM